MRLAKRACTAKGVALQGKMMTGAPLTCEEEATAAAVDGNKNKQLIQSIDFYSLEFLTSSEASYFSNVEAANKLALNADSTKEQLVEAVNNLAASSQTLALQTNQRRAEEQKAPQKRLENIETTIRDHTLRDLVRLGLVEDSPEFELHVLTKAQEHKEKEAAKAKQLCDELLAKAAAGSSGIASAEEQIAKAAAAEAAEAAEVRRQEAKAAAAKVEQQRMQTRKMTEAAEKVAEEQEAKRLAEEQLAEERVAKRLAEEQLAEERAASAATIAAGIAAGIANAPAPPAAAASENTLVSPQPKKKSGTKRPAEKTEEQISKAKAAAAKKAKAAKDAKDATAIENAALTEMVIAETEARIRKEVQNQASINEQQGSTNTSQQAQIASLEKTVKLSIAQIQRLKIQNRNLRETLAGPDVGWEDAAIEEAEFEGIEDLEEEDLEEDEENKEDQFKAI